MKHFDNPPDTKPAIRRFMVFLALVFLAQGLGSAGGIIGQPLTYYLKTAMHWEPDQVTRFFALLVIPWIVKPVYGLLSDFVPIFGYRRKSWLFLANGLVVAGYLWMTGLTQPPMILFALFLICFGMAATSTITEAVLVENGSKWGMSGKFLNEQWLWINVASIAASLGGGWLAQHFAPTGAFHTAAWIAACAPIGVLSTLWFLLDEQRTERRKQEQKDTGARKGHWWGTRELWMAGLFLFVWNIVPSFGTPLFYHMTDELKFSQGFIGLLGAIGSVGSILGSGAYALLAKKFKLSQLLWIAIIFGTMSQLSYILMNGHISAVIITIAGGVIGMVALVSSLTVAAHAAANRSAGFSFAVLMSVSNLSGQLSSNLGASLFVHVFHNNLNWVIFVAGVGTLLSGLIIPFLKLGDAGGNNLRKRTPVTVHPAVTANILKR